MAYSGMRILTDNGPVQLRGGTKTRDKVVMQVEGDNEKKTVQPKWLAGKDVKIYHTAVKQGLMIGSKQIALIDALDPESGSKSRDLPPDIIKENFQVEIQNIQDGKVKINTSGHKLRKLNKLKKTDEKDRHTFVKFSKRCQCCNCCCCHRRERLFVIEDGKFLIYKSTAKSAKIEGVPFELKDARVMKEEFKPGSEPYPPYDDGYTTRMRVDFAEREKAKKGSIFLYPKDKHIFKDWERAFKLARQLGVANDRRAMKVAIGRAISVYLTMGWKDLMAYYKELDSTKKVVRQMAMRLMKVDISRGWNKMKLINQMEKETKQMKVNQRTFAARYMSERLGKLGEQQALDVMEVREQTISRIQQKFRQYREEKIFNRDYLITSGVSSRGRKARQGTMTNLSLDSQSCESILKMTLDERGVEIFDKNPEMLRTLNQSYTHQDFHPKGKMLLSLSDNGNSLVFTPPDPAGRKHLNKVDLSNFVSLDRISNIVMNTEPSTNIKSLGKPDRGVWFTINGPRAVWGKRTEDVTEEEPSDRTKRETVKVLPDASLGVDGFAVPKAMSETAPSKNVSYMSCTVNVKAAQWNDLSDPKEKQKQQKAPDPDDEFTVVGRKLYLHVMGYRFAAYVNGDSKSFAVSGTVKIPIPKDKQGNPCTVGLDTSVIAAEVVEVREPKKPSSSRSNASGQKQTSTPRTDVQILTGSQTIKEIYDIPDLEASKVGSLTSKAHDLPLFVPTADSKEPSKGTLSLAIQMSQQASDSSRPPVSPEFAGGGVPMNVYTSHRGAWYDSSLKSGQFSLDHVPNFVELNLLNFKLPKMDGKNSSEHAALWANEHWVYRVRASLGGVSVTSPPFHRNRDGWHRIVGAEYGDTGTIDFTGVKLCVPLPPGYFRRKFHRDEYKGLNLAELISYFKEQAKNDPGLDPAWRKTGKQAAVDKASYDDIIAFLDRYAVNDRPNLKLELVGSELHTIFQAVTFADITSKGVRARKPQTKVLYHAQVEFQYMSVDQLQTVSCFMGLEKGPIDSYLTHVESNKSDTETGVTMNFDFALRDRDYVKGCLVKPGEHSILCVGDTCTLYTEEPIAYPKNKDEARRRYIKKPIYVEKDEKGVDVKDWKDPKRGAELRLPAISSEWNESGLANASPPIKFKQTVIPNYCQRQDILPHQFMMAYSENEFRFRQCPGVWPFVLDDLSNQKEADIASKKVPNSSMKSGLPPRSVVKYLSHTTRKLPVHLLAMYADGTSDCEVTPSFMEEWRMVAATKKGADRAYYFPGEATVIPSKIKGKTPRIILRQVPTMLLQSVQTMGFHVYNASWSNFEDIRSEKPDPFSVAQAQDDVKADQHHFEYYQSKVAAMLRSEYKVAAGPLPPDASPAAVQYEWSLHVRCSSESEMAQMVSMVRQCMRLDSFTTAQRMASYNYMGVETVMPDSSITRQIQGGQLEVVLVEARRLEATGYEAKIEEFKGSVPFFFEADKLGTLHPEQMEKLTAVTAGEQVAGTTAGAEIDISVNFRMSYGGKLVPFKSQTLQTSPVIKGGSPSWAAHEDYKYSGGYVFKTGQIDPAKFRDPEDSQKDLLLEFEVIQDGLGGEATLGKIGIGLHAQNLANERNPFTNMWLPLKSEHGILSDKVVTNPTGEIHIMTRWLTGEKLMALPGERAMTVKNEFRKVVWPRVVSQRVKEPIYGIEALYLNYNPNLVRGKSENEGKPKQPEPPKDFHERHVEELANAEKYLECIELRQEQFWREWIMRVEDEGHADIQIGDLRNHWASSMNSSKLSSLEELMYGGVPAERRERVWLELTGAATVMAGGQTDMGLAEAMQAGFKFYEQQLQAGIPQRSDANMQLQEDGFHLASWESSVPPNREAVDFHLSRLKRAQNVCTALIAFNDSRVCYCESLLIIAFYMLLPKNATVDPTTPESSMFSESSVFWLLYTVISGPNAAFQEYYGRPATEYRSRAPEGNMFDKALGAIAGDGDGAEGMTPRGGGGSSEPLCVGSGAMDDVILLESALAYYETELWGKLTAIGFQLATVFYGCFMRLFATYMPTATVFRFWDMLMFQSGDTRAQPNNRAYLIDLAFGILKSKAPELMECNSAWECRTLILGVLGSLYDMGTVVDIVLDAHKFLWTHALIGANRVTSMAQEREEEFRKHNEALVAQNDVLRALTHEITLGKIPQTKYESPPDSKGVQTKELLKDVLPVLQQGFGNLRSPQLVGQSRPTNFSDIWWFHRPMPLAANAFTEKQVTKTFNMLKTQFHSFMTQGQGFELSPVPVRPPPLILKSTMIEKKMKQCMDPKDFTQQDLQTVLNKDIPSWGNKARMIWEAFTNQRAKYSKWRKGSSQQEGDPNNSVYGGQSGGGYAEAALFDQDGGSGSKSGFFGFLDFLSNPEMKRERQIRKEQGQERISLNEFYMALICCSRGTLGEKASALFDRFSYDSDDPMEKVRHLVPMSSVGKSIMKVSDDTLTGFRNLYPPKKEEENENALCFKVMTHYPHNREMKMGEVFIPKIAPFMDKDPNDMDTIIFNIWGPPLSTQQMMNNRKGAGGAGGSSGYSGYDSGTVDGDKVCIGEMEMAIAWTPQMVGENTPSKSTGQLCIRLHSIHFHRNNTTEPDKKNPWVTVNTYDKSGREKQIELWDPRGFFATSQHHSYVTTAAAHGKYIEFKHTMNESMFNHSHLSHQYRAVAEAGWNEGTEQWIWDEKFGKQFSHANFSFEDKYMGTSRSAKKNVIDMLGVRLIVTGILQRTMLNVTNRQAILIADSLFNRSGAVPGIIGAVITKASEGEARNYTPIKGNGYATDKYDWAKLKEIGVDVTTQVAVEHERQVQFDGHLNMFTPDYLRRMHEMNKQPLGLSDIGIADPYPFVEKILWIYYVRSGDGQRCIQGVKFQAIGGRIHRYNVQEDESAEIRMDLLDAFPQTKVTKEEFISCLLNSPLLGESLRRLGSTDHTMHQKKAIPLDVTIMDPHHDQADEEFTQMSNVQQSVLLEVWDADMFRSDFLGEAWLPPLSTLYCREQGDTFELRWQDKDKKLKDMLKDAGFDVDGDDWWKETNMMVTDAQGEPLDFEKGHIDKNIEQKRFPLKFKNRTVILKDYVLPLKPADFSEYAEPFPSREEGKMAGKKITVEDNAKETDKYKIIKGEIHVSAAWRYPLWNPALKSCKDIKEEMEKKGTTQVQSLAARAEQQRLMHSGELFLKIHRCQELRRSDAKKGKECDASVHMWIRNDKTQEWQDTIAAKTSTIKNKRDPEWKNEFRDSPFEIMTGAYEEKVPELEEDIKSRMKRGFKGVFMKDATRREEEDRDLEAITARFGSDGLRLKFFETPGSGKGEEGENHQVEVFLGDTIREFKSKVTDACAKESSFHRSKGAASYKVASKYKDVNVGFKHLVMVFQPPQKVLQLAAQKLDKSKEYAHAYQLAIADPSSWQPLDPTRTFGQYPQYGFGRKQENRALEQRLRIVEETEAYKLVNLRYASFAQEREKTSWQDTNKNDVCYGWAKYTHEGVGAEHASEWRPAMLKFDRASTAEQRSKNDPASWVYEVSWVFPPYKEPAPKSKAQSGDDKSEAPPPDAKLEAVKDGERQVMVHARYPKFEDIDPLHWNILKENITPMRQMGKSDWEISDACQKILDTKVDTALKQGSLKRQKDRVPPITVDVIRSYTSKLNK